ncbi:aspartate kinase [Marasmius fiardii PR-910]|nr:aspartate kinase [Marasmius fiardii PR-910]
MSSNTHSEPSTPISTPPKTPPKLHQNSIDPDSKWLVQKFGGTSVGKYPVRIARDVVSNYIDSNKVAIVCSARSGSTKSLGTTNMLLRAAAEALKRPPRSPKSTAPGASTPGGFGIFGQVKESPYSPQLPGSPPSRRSFSENEGNPLSLSPLTVPSAGQTTVTFNVTVDLIREEHYKAAKESIQDVEIRKELEEEIDRDCDWLRSFLFASKVIDEISPRSKDSIIGLGERLACKLMTAVLRDQGVDAEYVSLEDIVPEHDESETDKQLGQNFYDHVAAAVGERVKQCGQRVPVVTGFFGPVPGSLLAQVGRGYTDLLSALLAVGLQAAELQIWKEVDGIFTADPRKVPTARVLPIITPDEAAELTYYGSEVVHPFTMEQAIRRKIPIRIKNVENPSGAGTVIHPDPDVVDVSQEAGALTNGVPEPITSSKKLYDPTVMSLLQPNELNRLPTAVTIKENILVININSNRKSVSHGFFAGIFGTLDRFGVVVDLISTSEVHVSMAIEGSLAPKLLDRLVRELKKNGMVTVHHNMAILSLVGKNMRHLVGVAGRMFTTLGQGNVNIEMISQGASEINISCVIEGRDAVKALNLIHQSCLQIPPPSRVGPWLF